MSAADHPLLNLAGAGERERDSNTARGSNYIIAAATPAATPDVYSFQFLDARVLQR